ncbi:hypothetical protein ROA7450_04018 [Roseovarius albus]|uniref:DUF3775 domain-containing protein n=1 Tax=Roseovarius albus TaxID=1247867 RepID=A0A1X7A744_9RHOB|nr:DUF3775 domain-containing protein [Roseovarius albus]SLN72276.1 hypothetical protein ROA7450_04018 [Roseovarius albus]
MIGISTHKIAQIILMSRELDRAERELRGFIERLTEEEQVSLVAVMWIGRDSFMRDELEEAKATAREEATTPTVDYLLGTPHLSDHLENGLDELGISVVEDEDELVRGG